MFSENFEYSDWFMAFLPYWPPGEPIGLDRERTEWVVRTLDDIPVEKMHLVSGSNLNYMSPELSIESRVAGAREIVMKCTALAQLEGPQRIWATEPAWRFLDEQVARVWTIGAYPRLCFSTFKRQGEGLVGRIPEQVRSSWLGLALLRARPMLDRAAGKGNCERDEPPAFLDTPSALAEGLAEWSFSGLSSLGVGDSSRLLTSAVKAAVASTLGDSIDSIQLMTYAAERFLEAYIQLDEARLSDENSSFAMREDRLWFDDALRLAEASEASYDLVERSREFASDLTNALSSTFP